MKTVKLNSKNVTSKLMLFVCVAIMATGFNACKKVPPIITGDYNAGEIPGLGNTEGELTGTPFRLPEGIELTGNITGVDYSQRHKYNYWDLGDYVPARSFINKRGEVEKEQPPIQRTGEDVVINYFGSGEGYVDLLFPLRNVTSTPITITFPAATIMRSKAGDCQNAVLIKQVKVIIPANSDYLLCVVFYCGNLSKSSAYSDDIYELGVVSDAKPLLDLCERVKNKKINIEEFSPTSMADYETYSSQTYRLQSIVWEITDYSGLDDYDIEYINSLPNSQ